MFSKTKQFIGFVHKKVMDDIEKFEKFSKEQDERFDTIKKKKQMENWDKNTKERLTGIVKVYYNINKHRT